jgi:hypothetical protein
VGVLKWGKDEIFNMAMEEAIHLAKIEENKIGRPLTSEELYSIYVQAIAHYRINSKRFMLKPTGLFAFTFVFSIVAMWLVIWVIRWIEGIK